MIQRIQSLFLVLVELFGFAGAFLIFMQTDLSNIQLSFAIAMVLIALLQMPIIILFKKRTLQITLCKIFLAILMIVSVLSVSYSDDLAIGIGAIIPVIQFLFVFLALRAIKKDEELIRSVDRIR